MNFERGIRAKQNERQPQKNISGENRGQWGKREGHWSFLFPRRGLKGYINEKRAL
jgi:hypothetical protein